jgi:hypothetical protein
LAYHPEEVQMCNLGDGVEGGVSIIHGPGSLCRRRGKVSTTVLTYRIAVFDQYSSVAMASTITYLIVSSPDDPDSVRDHRVIEECDFDLHAEQKRTDNQCASVTFVHESTLEDHWDATEPARELSTAFPSATVVLHVIEERFDHIERLQMNIYSGGRNAGEVEHGYVFNIGGD